ncbi:MAG: hypothetical protein ACI4UT_03695 [Candidatus Enteromonas sp.]
MSGGGLLLTLCDVALVSVGFSAWATSEAGIGPFSLFPSVEVGLVVDEGGLFSFSNVTGFSLCQDGIVDGATKTIVDSATLRLTLGIDCAKARDAGYVANDVFSASFVLKANSAANPNLLNFVTSLAVDGSALSLGGISRDDLTKTAIRTASYSLGSFPTSDKVSLSIVYSVASTYSNGTTTYNLSGLSGSLPSLTFIVNGGTAS